ncbi:hypothetical protein [Actinoalloteichus caeruleus]|uniref:Septum formation-related domain-containing protein n=1 Tax=Actinoalloteichus caeruleus DSM 43889 TaxID=1120930 RepID=A0ABT1JDR3_ACTCY|nr:hypothetical protein [Actinoalloteichus caeruleus]MCP2330639.1 hypothetical protein [Actinoalloteichus caeruleus DSM 43889]
MMRRPGVLIPAVLAFGGVFLVGCGEGSGDQEPTSPGDGVDATTGSGLDEPTTDPGLGAPTSGSATSGAGTAEPGAGGAADDGATSATDDLERVDCGEIETDTGAHRLIAMPTVGGRVGCTEAFNVIDEFLSLPDEEKAEAALGNVDVSHGWSCTVDDGETAGIACVKGSAGDDYEFAFHTEP